MNWIAVVLMGVANLEFLLGEQGGGDGQGEVGRVRQQIVGLCAGITRRGGEG